MGANPRRAPRARGELRRLAKGGLRPLERVLVLEPSTSPRLAQRRGLSREDPSGEEVARELRKPVGQVLRQRDGRGDIACAQKLLEELGDEQ